MSPTVSGMRRCQRPSMLVAVIAQRNSTATSVPGGTWPTDSMCTPRSTSSCSTAVLPRSIACSYSARAASLRWARASSTRSPIRACSANRVAWTGTGNVSVASMLAGSLLRKMRVVVTIARPASMITSKRVATSGMGVDAADLLAMNVCSGSILVCGAVNVIARLLLQEVGQQVLDAFNQRAALGTAADEVWIDDERDAWRHDEWGTLLCLQKQLDRRGREAQVAQPHVTADGRDMVVAVVRIGPSAARRGHETFRDQVADLPLRNGGQPDQVTNIHRRAFRQRTCQKDEAGSRPFDILFVERMKRSPVRRRPRNNCANFPKSRTRRSCGGPARSPGRRTASPSAPRGRAGWCLRDGTGRRRRCRQSPTRW